jgi:plastocyanin
MRYLRSLALVPLAALAIAGCGDDAPTDGAPADGATTDSAAEQSDTATADGAAEMVDIVDFTFEPEALEVTTGTTVEWVQQDSSRHTVDFDDGEESGHLEEGDIYRRTFDQAGTYDYVCFFHPRMTASVTVTE